MNAENPKDNENSLPGALVGWLNYRKKRFWVLVLLLLYTLAGFWLAPWWLKSTVIDYAQTQLGRQASIESVRINPFSLTLDVTGFELLDTDSVRLASLDELFVNFELSSLFRRAWTFETIRMVAPYFLLERYGADESRLSRLLEDLPSDTEPAADDSGESALPRFLIHSLSIAEGSGLFRDQVPATPVEVPIGPISVDITDLSTLENRDGNQTVHIALPEGAELSWQGTLNLAPLDSVGRLELTGSRLGQTRAYLTETLPIEDLNGTLSASLDYRVQLDESGGFELTASDLAAELSELSVRGLEPSEEFFSLGRMVLEGGMLDLSERRLELGRILVENPRMLGWMDENGDPSLLQLAGESPPDEPGPESGDSDADWRISVSQLDLQGGLVDWTDRSIEPNASLALSDLRVAASQLTNEAGAGIPFSLAGVISESGLFEVEGTATVLPEVLLDVETRLDRVPLTLGQPYLGQMALLQINGGVASSRMNITLSEGAKFGASGSVNVEELSINDSRDDSVLLGWKQLEIDRMTVESSPSRVHISQVVVDELYSRIAIREDRSTNLDGIMREPASGAGDSANGENPDTALELIVGRTAIRDGGMDFSDFSLPLPFATRISGMNGSLSTIANTSSEPATIDLEGQVDEYGLARIGGSINLLDPIGHTDTRLEFRNLQMSNLTPYTAEFAGREIDDGKLDLDLNYVIKDGKLEGQNKVVLTKVVLGKEVDSPDAANLPLGLAVALLQDTNGVIDIDLPVEGDINDPEFRIGGVIWKAFTGLITKVVSAPFRLLGSLIGVDSEDLGQFQFLAGRSDLTPPELEKVAQLEQALAERPELSIEVKGVYDRAIDTPALQYQRLRSAVIERLQTESGDNTADLVMLDDDVRQALEAIFAERNADVPLAEVKAEHTAPPPGDPEGEPVLDALAYAADLRDRLLEAEEISDAELTALAEARAAAIRDAFMSSGTFSEDRVSIAGTEAVESEDEEWVVLELGVAAQ